MNKFIFLILLIVSSHSYAKTVTQVTDKVRLINILDDFKVFYEKAKIAPQEAVVSAACGA